ncbi:hypothetical protein [Tychonema sp. LEGE 06208]|uniref:hypothetical protein n=2 Tax=Tychonema sp. LEGE 06208 TaxID=1828663 RepID=UPI0030DA36ED
MNSRFPNCYKPSMVSFVTSSKKLIHTPESTINSQQSTINSQQPTVNTQQSTINSQQSTVNNQQSTVNNQQSTVNNHVDCTTGINITPAMRQSQNYHFPQRNTKHEKIDIS